MQNSLDSRLSEKIATKATNTTAMEAMKKELQARRDCKELAAMLMSVEDHYPRSELMDEALSPGLRLLEVREIQIPILNRFHALCHPTETNPFNYILLASEAVNSGANVRANVNWNFGPQTDWIMWSADVVEFGFEKIAYVSRYHLSGILSDVRRACPDTLSRLEAEANGLSLQGLKRPIFIVDAYSLR